MRRAVAALAAVLLCGFTAHGTDIQSLVAPPQQRIESADFRAVGHLVRVDAAGNRTSDEITIEGRWFPGVLRVLVEWASAPKTGPESMVRARIVTHILLEMRPEGQSSIRIARPGDKAAASLPFDKWSDGPLGPGFSYEDFLEPQWFWADQEALAPVKFGARNCDVLKSKPGPGDRTHYSEVKSWLDHGIGFPVYVEKTQKGSGAVKEFTYMGLRQTGGVWSASQMEARVRGEAGSTLLVVERGSTRANLTAADFDAAHMTHF